MMPRIYTTLSATSRRLMISLMLILGFLTSLSTPHNLRPGSVLPPPSLVDKPPPTHNPSDISPPVWIPTGGRNKNLAYQLDAPPDYSSLKYPVLSLNPEDLHHSITGFSRRHSCKTKAHKLFHINGVPRAIRGDDVDALYPKGFASWLGQDPFSPDWKEGQQPPQDENDRPAAFSNTSSPVSPVQQPKAGIPGYTMSALPQNIGLTSECISVSSNGLPLRSLLLSTARPYVSPLSPLDPHSEYIPSQYDAKKPSHRLLPFRAGNLPPNGMHIPPTQAALWMAEGCRGPPDHLSHTPHPPRGGRTKVSWKGKGEIKGASNSWAEHCVVMPEQVIGLRPLAGEEHDVVSLGKLGLRGGWRSMRVWYGSAEVPVEMFGTGGQFVDTEGAGTKDEKGDEKVPGGVTGEMSVAGKLKEQMLQLPPAQGKKSKSKKKGGK